MEELRVFCQNIEMLRRKNDLTKREMARILNLSLDDILQIEKAILPDRVTVEMIFLIEKHFGVCAKDQFCPLTDEAHIISTLCPGAQSSVIASQRNGK